MCFLRQRRLFAQISHRGVVRREGPGRKHLKYALTGLGDMHSQRIGQDHEGLQGEVAFAPLDFADMRPVQPRSAGEHGIWQSSPDAENHARRVNLVLQLRHATSTFYGKADTIRCRQVIFGEIRCMLVVSCEPLA